MKRHRSKIGLAAAVLLPLGLVLAIALVAAGQEAEPTGASAGGSALVPAAEFVDDGFTAFDFAYNEAGGYTYVTTDTFACMQAPVYLPDGATVSSFGAYVYDDDPSGWIQNIELRRVGYQPGPESLSDLMASTSTDSGGANDEVEFVFDDSVGDPIVDTSQYVYYTVVCMSGGPGDTLRLYAVEAFYSQ